MNITYIRSGNYYIPDLTLPEESRPIGRWGRMHRDYLREHRPIQYNCLLLSGKLWTYLADLNEQSQTRLARVIEQMKAAEGITEALKASDPMAWVQRSCAILWETGNGRPPRFRVRLEWPSAGVRRLSLARPDFQPRAGYTAARPPPPSQEK